MSTYKKILTINTETELTNFHSKEAAPYLKALITKIRSGFNLKNLPLLQAITALNPNNNPSKKDPLFESHGYEMIDTLLFSLEKHMTISFKTKGNQAHPYFPVHSNCLKWSQVCKNHFVQLKIDCKKNHFTVEAGIKTKQRESGANKYKNHWGVAHLEQQNSGLNKT